MRAGSEIRRRGGGLLFWWMSGGLLAAVLTWAPAATAAGPAEAERAEVSRLEAECAHLRSELARVNEDVAALKRAGRGVRNDYRLRHRMADAEALARKLTEAEARLAARRGPALVSRPPALAPPRAQPGDGPVELEAKADLLVDQARRLAVEAEGLDRTARQLRGRQALRRRALQLERDPFVGLDGSKRTMVFGAPRSSPSAERTNDPKMSAGGPSKSGSADEAASSGARGSGTTMPGAGGSVPPTTAGGPAPTGQPAPSPPSAPAPNVSPPPSLSPSAPGGQTAAPRATEGGMAAGPSPQPTSALSTQLRALLDPYTLSEVRRLEQTGLSITDPEALERLAVALRQRAQALDAQAKDLRVKARP